MFSEVKPREIRTAIEVMPPRMIAEKITASESVRRRSGNKGKLTREYVAPEKETRQDKVEAEKRRTFWSDRADAKSKQSNMLAAFDRRRDTIDTINRF